MKSYLWTVSGTGSAQFEASILNPNPPKYTAGALANAILENYPTALQVSIDQSLGSIVVTDPVNPSEALAVFTPVLVDPSEALIFE